MNMRKTVVALVAMLLSISAFARDYGYDKEIRYRSEDDAYVDKMCRLDACPRACAGVSVRPGKDRERTFLFCELIFAKNEAPGCLK